MNLEFKGSWLKYILETFHLYNGDAKYLYIYIVAVIILLFQKDRWIRQAFIYPLFIIFMTIFNPFVLPYVFYRLDLSLRYYRFIWLLPFAIVISFVAIELLSKIKNKIIFAIAVACFTIILLLSGNVQKRFMDYKVTNNIYKVSDEVIDISSAIHRVSKEKQPNVAYEDNLMMEYRTYDPSVISVFNRDNAINRIDVNEDYINQCTSNNQYGNILYAVVGYGYQIPYEQLEECLKCTNTDFLVINKRLSLEHYLLGESGITKISDTKNYTVYGVN